jgi:hypothetical protein
MNWKILNWIKKIMIYINFNRLARNKTKFYWMIRRFDLVRWFGECHIACDWTDQVGLFDIWIIIIFLFKSRQFLYVEFKDWLAQATDIRLSDKIDMTSSKYEYTGRFWHLFCDEKYRFLFKIIFYVMMMIYMEQLKVVVLLLFIILYLMIGKKQTVELWIYLIRMVNIIDWIFFVFIGIS